MKSIVHIWLARAGGWSGIRASARKRLRFPTRIANPSSREIRYTRLRFTTHFRAPPQPPLFRFPAVEGDLPPSHPWAGARHRPPRLGLLQHPYDLLLTEPALPHQGFSSRVLYPEKLHFGWTSFRGAGHLRAQFS